MAKTTTRANDGRRTIRFWARPSTPEVTTTPGRSSGTLSPVPNDAGGGFAAAAARGFPVNMTSIPATLPAGEIVGRLNQAQPRALLVHASTLVLLAGEQRAGRLRISPRAITAVSEPLAEDDRIAIGDAFEVPPVSQFTSTEGLAGYSQPGGAEIRFATDMCIVELVDEENRPVADGMPSAKVLLTNLHNHTQPLIRYELTDRFIRRPAGGDPYLHATVQGRADEAFQYGSVTIDALMIRTVMVKVQNVTEYQVRQTDNGIDVAIIADGALDHGALAAWLERMLRTAGVFDPRVHVHEVAAIPRLPQSGKARRFIPRWSARFGIDMMAETDQRTSVSGTCRFAGIRRHVA